LKPLSQDFYDVLIIGCGNIAGVFDMTRAVDQPALSHAGAYTRNGKFKLKGCVDPDEQKRIAFAKHWKIKDHSSDLEALNGTIGSFDVISICSPTVLHHKHLDLAIDLQPRLIFCEKPLTLDLSTARSLVDRCHAMGITLAINYSRRWDPSIDELIDQLNRGQWGLVRSVIGHYNKGIMNNGGHMIDLLLRILGPLEFVTTSTVNFDFPGTDPTVAALLSADSGRVPVYLSPACAGDYSIFELELICSLGLIRMESGGISWSFRKAIPTSDQWK
jgi:predicted dehydrogenase